MKTATSKQTDKTTTTTTQQQQQQQQQNTNTNDKSKFEKKERKKAIIDCFSTAHNIHHGIREREMENLM